MTYNKNIQGPKGALLTLQHIDFDRMQDLDLQTKIVLYTSNSFTDNNLTARYEGHPITSETDIALPKPTYNWQEPNEFQNELKEKGLIEGKSLFTKPSNLEFVLMATNEQEYNGLKVFANQFLPTLFQEGYDKENSKNNSVFWLHAGYDNPHNKEYLLSISQNEGLSIGNTHVGDIRVFTPMDVKRFMGLEMKNLK